MAKAKTKAATTTKKVTKKPTSPAKKATTKKASVATAPQAQFFQVRVTDQSLYWLIFGIIAIIFAMWIYTLDAKVRDLYDQIDANTYSTEVTMQKQAVIEKAQQETE